MLKVLVLCALTSFIICSSLKKTNQVMPLVTPPPGGANLPFSSSCSFPRVSGFNLMASCTNSMGVPQNASLYFGNCVKNYNGNLLPFSGGAEELFTRNCSTDGFSLNCECQQPTGGFLPCSVSLDTIFTTNNGQLFC